MKCCVGIIRITNILKIEICKIKHKDRTFNSNIESIKVINGLN